MLKDKGPPVCIQCKKVIIPDMPIHYIGQFDDEGDRLPGLVPMCGKCYRAEVC